MSTLKVTNIQSNGAGFNDVVSFQNSGGTENGRLCRAFVNFNGTGTVAIRQSFNVSSITDNGTGDYTVNFTSALPDANYAITQSCEAGSGSIGAALNIRASSIASSPTLKSTTQVRFRSGYGSTNSSDLNNASIAIFR